MTASMSHPLKGHAIRTRAQRLAWARGVRMEMQGHSDARLRRAARIFLAEAGTADHADRSWAEMMLAVLPTGARS